MLDDLSVASIAALAGAAVLVIGAVAAGIVQIIKAFQSIAVIEGHVNSEKTASQGREAAKDVKIQLLEKMLDDREKTAALLAQSVATAAAAAKGQDV